jgi:hypothetical protein
MRGEAGSYREMAETSSGLNMHENRRKSDMTEIIYIRTNNVSREGEDALLRWLDVRPDELTEELRQRVLREVWKFFDELFEEQAKKTGGSVNER